MVKHNNVIPNVHLRKHWQTNVRVWLNQAARKKSRLQARRAKAASIAPRPLDHLRPVVHCTTIRYNHRQRNGRGFTLQEIKAAGLGVNFARSVGIAVDHRRKNRSQESLDKNKQRLLQYVNNLALFSRNEKKPITKAKAGTLNDTPKVLIIFIQENLKVNADATVNALPKLITRVKPIGAALLDSVKKNRVFRTLRQEWNNQRNEGKRLKKAREAE